jgi:hypothetical protein
MPARLQIVVISEGVISANLLREYQTVAPYHGGAYAGVPFVPSIDDFVSSIQRICSSRADAVVGRVLLVAHGNEKGVTIGNDRLTLESFRKFKPKLAELKPLFDPIISSVVFQACELGRNPALLRCLSTVWGGIPVRAYSQQQHPDEPTGQGPSVVCRMSTCQM